VVKECWQVPESAAGERLDRYLARQQDRARSQVQRWIKEGRVRVNGAPAKPSLVLAGGELLDCDPRESPSPRAPSPEEGAIEVLFEDCDLVVVNKSPDVAVHPGAGHSSGTLVHFLLARYPEMAGVGSAERPGIVHRLDKGTSGVLVVARSERAYRRLSNAFSTRSVGKRYLAMVYGVPDPPRGRTEAPIGRHPHERKRMAVRRDGRPALTIYRTLASHGGISLLEIDLGTGRTHQIRVHLKSLGHPLIGDPVYGEARWKGLPPRQRDPLQRFSRPALHAWRLAFLHPASDERVLFEAPMPEDMRTLWSEATGSELPDLGPSQPV
jgi:23S rRNA pseudouridine1911/1915/1917 synthase